MWIVFISNLFNEKKEEEEENFTCAYTYEFAENFKTLWWIINHGKLLISIICLKLHSWLADGARKLEKFFMASHNVELLKYE